MEPPLTPPHVTVGGIRIFDGDLAAAAAYCVPAIESRVGATVATANLDFFALARRNATLRANLDRASLVVADGAPIALLARMNGGGAVRRVAGVDLVDRIFRESEGLGSLRVGLYGSEPRIADAATASIRSRYPWVEFVAAVHPPFGELTAEEEQDHIDELVAASPQVCLVMLGCPRQEDVIRRFYHQIPSAVWIGVGGTLDFYAGKRRRAPRWAQRAGLEWAVRLVQEPRRLWRRYLLRDIPELIALTRETAMRRAGRGSRQLPSN